LLSARKLLAQIGAIAMLYKEEWLQVNEKNKVDSAGIFCRERLREQEFVGRAMYSLAFAL
jgi:hypothetical protein